MIHLNIDYSKVKDFISEDEINSFQKGLTLGHQQLVEKTGKGNDFLGWVNLPSEIDEALIKSIEDDAKAIKEMADIYVVIGIGGSYLGARAVIEALNHNFAALQADRTHPFIVYAGQNISEDYMAELLEILDKRDYALTVISKSGTTTEPAVAFRILKNHLEKKYGKENDTKNKCIQQITFPKKLKLFCKGFGYIFFYITRNSIVLNKQINKKQYNKSKHIQRSLCDHSTKRFLERYFFIFGQKTTTCNFAQTWQS